MPLVTSKEMLEYAREARFAVGAFNADNMEMVQAIVEVAAEERAPVIVQVSAPTIRYAGLSLPAGMVQIAAAEVDVPVVLHLDHGADLEQNAHALRAGFTSLMFDGSRLPYDDNVARTADVVRLAHAAGIPVEAELGQVLEVSGDGASPEAVARTMTDPEQAADFVRCTGCDSLAVAAGSVHAMTGRHAELDVERIAAIARRVALPLVLHGSSGVKHDSLVEGIARGICKVNVATYLKQGFMEALLAAIAAQPGEVDFRKLFAPAREAVKERIREKLRLFGASGRVDGTRCQRYQPARSLPRSAILTGGRE